MGSSPGCSQRSCREPPAHIKHSHALYPPLGPPEEERICHFWLTNPSHSLGPGSLDSTRQSHPSGEDGPRGRAHEKRVSKRKMRALITSGTRFGLNYSGSH